MEVRRSLSSFMMYYYFRQRVCRKPVIGLIPRRGAMCELMGMSFAKPVVANVSIQAFSKRSQENADGWGLAWYPDRSLALVKQPVRWSVQTTQFLEQYPGLLSSIYVAHVRQRTTGSTPTHADTHPFARELNGREYCFAHNGTLTGAFWQRPLGRFRPIGGTDSEYVFCLLLAELESYTHVADEVAEVRHINVQQHDGKLMSEGRWRWLHQFLIHMNEYGRLNCILSDGERLLVYHDKNGWKSLTYRNVFLQQDYEQTFGDATVAVNLQAQPVNHGVIVATNPLSIEGWERFLPGEMKVLCQGNIEFSARPNLHETKRAERTKAESVHSSSTAPESLVLSREKA
jgi:predicted glutamine amidotransferase